MAVQTLAPVLVHNHEGPWTWEDLPTREELRGWRAEIVDGALLLMAPPKRSHDVVAFRLATALAGACPQGATATTGGAIHHAMTWRQPDAMVFRTDAPGDGPLEGEDVLVAVEVQSPSSVTNDRVTKQHEYASVGIRHYWRMVLEPEPVLHVLELVDGAYVEVVALRAGEVFHAVEPFEVTVRMDDLLR